MKAYSLVGDSTVVGTPVQGVLPINSQDEGELRMYRLMFPYLPPSKNVFDGWPPAWKSSAKKKWLRAVERQVKALQIPPASKIGLAAVLVFPTNGRRDIQNYANCLWHWIPDGLVNAGVLSDDREGMIEFGPNLGIKFAVDNRVAPKEKRKRTHVVLTMEVAK